VEEATKDVTLETGQNETVSFTIIRETEGSYTVDIDGETGQFNVIVPQPIKPEPEAEPTPTPSGGGLSCGRSPGAQASGLGDLALLLGVVLVCFGLTRFRRR